MKHVIALCSAFLVLFSIPAYSTELHASPAPHPMVLLPLQVSKPDAKASALAEDISEQLTKVIGALPAFTLIAYKGDAAWMPVTKPIASAQSIAAAAQPYAPLAITGRIYPLGKEYLAVLVIAGSSTSRYGTPNYKAITQRQLFSDENSEKKQIEALVKAVETDLLKRSAALLTPYDAPLSPHNYSLR